MQNRIIAIFLIVSLSFEGCINKSDKSDYKLIDLGSFSIRVPSDFEYKKVKGIDSFVGRITNGESTFSFDYGMYSPEPPLTENQFLEMNSKNMDFDGIHLLMRVIDTKLYEYEANGKVNVREITKNIRNLKLKKRTDDVQLSVYPNKKPKYYYSLELDNKTFNIPFFAYEKHLDDIKEYEIKIDTINNYKRTVSIWKDKSIEKYSSLNLIPLNRDSYNNHLWIGINSNTKLSKETIERIFNSVEIKNN